MPTFGIVLYFLIFLLLGIAAILGGFLLLMYSEKRAYREARTIICPENLDYAQITVDGERAARTALEGQEEYRIATCSRWPEKQGCDEECAAQFPLAGDDRTHGQYAAFGMNPDQIRSKTPVRITPDMFGAVMKQKIVQYLNKRTA